MTNILKRLKIKYRKKRLMAKKKRIIQEQKRASGLERNVKRRSSKSTKHKYKISDKPGTLVAVIIAVGLCLCFYFEKRSYHRYTVIENSQQEDIVSTNYMEMSDGILRYSPDTVSLVSKNLETIWSEEIEMQNPVGDVNGNRAVIADKDGTTLMMYDEEGFTGSVATSYSIIKIRISKGGMVAAILDGGEDTWINFYSYDGSLIAENQTKLENPGYPLDVDVSDDGKVMMVTYQFVDGEDTTSYVAFYNFGDVGQNEENRIVSGYTYEGVVIPQIQYLDSSESIAFRDDGFTLYEGKQIPKEIKTVTTDKEIVSTFYDEQTVGLVFKNDSKDKMYTMEVYNKQGGLKFKKDFNVPYTTIRMSGGNIVMYDSSRLCVINSRGVEKYMGVVDGTVKNFFKLGRNRYLLVLDNGVNVIKLG